MAIDQNKWFPTEKIYHQIIINVILSNSVFACIVFEIFMEPRLPTFFSATTHLSSSGKESFCDSCIQFWPEVPSVKGSASTFEVVTVDCFLDLYETAPPAIEKLYPVVDFRSTLPAAQQKSLCPIICFLLVLPLCTNPRSADSLKWR